MILFFFFHSVIVFCCSCLALYAFSSPIYIPICPTFPLTFFVHMVIVPASFSPVDAGQSSTVTRSPFPTTHTKTTQKRSFNLLVLIIHALLSFSSIYPQFFVSMTRNFHLHMVYFTRSRFFHAPLFHFIMTYPITWHLG